MENILLDIGGKEFYFDLDALSEAVIIENKDSEAVIIENKDIVIDKKCEESEKRDNTHQIDVTNMKCIENLIGTILTSNEIVDDKMGIIGLNSLSIPFKLSFNTLIIKKILKEL